MMCGTEDSEEISIQVQTNVQTWCDLLMMLLVTKHSFVTKGACVKVITQLSTKFYNNISTATLYSIESLLKNDLSSTENRNDCLAFGLHEYLTNGTVCVLVLQAKKKSCDDIVDTLKRLLLHSSYEVYNTVLLFVQCLLREERDKIDREMSNVVKSFSKEIILDLTLALNKSYEFCGLLVQKTLLRNHHEDGIKLLSTLKDLPLVFEILTHRVDSVVLFFERICKFEHELIAAVALQCIDAYFKVVVNMIS